MTQDQFNDRLRPLDDKKMRELTALTGDIRREASEPIQAAVALALGHDPKSAPMAKYVLADLGELAVAPLLAAPIEGAPPFEKVWLCQTVVSADLELRAAIVRLLDKMLEIKTIVPPVQAIGAMEESLPPTRVCDEAYLQMRRLLNISEGQATNARAERAFLGFPEVRKDAEIRQARQDKTWTQLLK